MENPLGQNAQETTHESAVLHVTGEAIYINDMEAGDRLLIGTIVQSPHAHALIRKIDIREAANLKGVHAVLVAGDIPGDNQMGPVVHDEPCLAETEVTFVGQAVAVIAAETGEIALAAARLVHVEYEVLDAIITIEQAIELNSRLAPQRKIERGSRNN